MYVLSHFLQRPVLLLFLCWGFFADKKNAECLRETIEQDVKFMSSQVVFTPFRIHTIKEASTTTCFSHTLTNWVCAGNYRLLSPGGCPLSRLQNNTNSPMVHVSFRIFVPRKYHFVSFAGSNDKPAPLISGANNTF